MNLEDDEDKEFWNKTFESKMSNLFRDSKEDDDYWNKSNRALSNAFKVFDEPFEDKINEVVDKNKNKLEDWNDDNDFVKLQTVNNFEQGRNVEVPKSRAFDVFDDEDDDKFEHIPSFSKTSQPKFSLNDDFKKNEVKPSSRSLINDSTEEIKANRSISALTGLGLNKTIQSTLEEPISRSSIPAAPFNRVSSTLIDSVTKNNNSSSAPILASSNSNSTVKILKENIKLKTEISKTSADYKYLLALHENKPDLKETVDRILLNKPFWLDLYKSKKDKISLLHQAIYSFDGNAILAIILFIKKTLNEQSFYEILCSNPVAFNHYVFYLEQLNLTEELYSLYKFQGNHNEAASIKYLRPVLNERSQDLAEKVLHTFENKVNSNELSSFNNLNNLNVVKKKIALLKIQKEILKNRASFLRKDEKRQIAMDNLHGSSLAYTFSFCLKYQAELVHNEAYSLENFKKEFDISNKQFSIWFVKALAEIGSWTELESYTNQRGILNTVKNPPVSFEAIVNIISVAKGPSEQIKKYLLRVENLDVRLEMAQKFDIPDVIIDTFRLKKDFIGLSRYRYQLKEGTPESAKADTVLRDPGIKWKNKS